MRSVLLVAHTSRHSITLLAHQVTEQLRAAGFEVRMLADEAAACRGDDVTTVAHAGAAGGTRAGAGPRRRRHVPARGRARPAGRRADARGQPRPRRLPRRGRAGRAARPSRQSSQRRVRGRGAGHRRRRSAGRRRAARPAWALNEASIERTNRERMLEVAVAVDGRPLLRFGCDGVLCATPTGSTAYAFSAGGPIVWPNVDALLVVPNAAHALFSRPIVVAPGSTVDIDLVSHGARGGAQLRRPASLSCRSGARVRVRRGAQSDPDRAAGRLELRRPAGHQVPAAGADPARGSIAAATPGPTASRCRLAERRPGSRRRTGIAAGSCWKNCGSAASASSTTQCCRSARA